MTKKEKYFGNREVIKKIYNSFKAEKISESKTFFKRHGVDDIGTKTFYDISSGNKKFEYSKFETIAKAFTKELRIKDKDKIVLADELIKEKIKKDTSKLHATLWTIKDSSDLALKNFKEENKKIFSFIKEDEEIVQQLTFLFKNLEEPQYLRNNLNNDSFELELGAMAQKARINSNINSLKKMGVCIHVGEVYLPLISFDRDIISLDDGLDQYTAKAKNIYYNVILISNCNEVDPEIIFNLEFTLNDLEKIIEKNPFSFESLSLNENEVLETITNYYVKNEKWIPTLFTNIDHEWKRNSNLRFLSDPEIFMQDLVDKQNAVYNYVINDNRFFNFLNFYKSENENFFEVNSKENLNKENREKYLKETNTTWILRENIENLVTYLNDPYVEDELVVANVAELILNGGENFGEAIEKAKPMTENDIP